MPRRKLDSGLLTGGGGILGRRVTGGGGAGCVFFTGGPVPAAFFDFVVDPAALLKLPGSLPLRLPIVPAAGKDGLVAPMSDECDPSPPESAAPPSASEASEFAEGEWEFLEMWDATEGVGVERSLEEDFGFEPGKPSLYLGGQQSDTLGSRDRATNGSRNSRRASSRSWYKENQDIECKSKPLDLQPAFPFLIFFAGEV